MDDRRHFFTPAIIIITVLVAWLFTAWAEIFLCAPLDL
jgi:hypothetical protein